MCERPDQYRWSSHRCHAYGETDLLVTFHSGYLQLADAADARQTRYQGWFRQPAVEHAKGVRVKSTAGPEKQRIAKTVNVPAALEPLALDKPLVEQGKLVYQQYCYMCHGVEGMSGGVIPDLRFAQAETYAEWQNIVINGSRANNGMHPFAGVISIEEAMAVRAYAVSRALKAKPKNYSRSIRMLLSTSPLIYSVPSAP